MALHDMETEEQKKIHHCLVTISETMPDICFVLITVKPDGERAMVSVQSNMEHPETFAAIELGLRHVQETKPTEIRATPFKPEHE